MSKVVVEIEIPEYADGINFARDALKPGAEYRVIRATGNLRPSAPPRGEPGCHLGSRVTCAYCTVCEATWIWNIVGGTMGGKECFHDDADVVIVEYEAMGHGRLSERPPY